jgi:hypothetical protein
MRVVLLLVLQPLKGLLLLPLLLSVLPLALQDSSRPAAAAAAAAWCAAGRWQMLGLMCGLAQRHL